MFRIQIVLLLVVAFVLAYAGKSHAQQDRFAKIGGQQYELRKDLLIEPQPLSLPDKVLPGGMVSSSAINFKRNNETKEALYAELDSIRKVYLPFLENYAPLASTGRSRIPIPSMSWRKETDADLTHFQHTLEGKGEWTQVDIPHYGPPLGHAVTYYTREIDLADSMLNKGSLFVCFKGVDYKAEVFFNGAFCGSHEGFFAPFEFNIKPFAKKGKNRLLVKVINEPTTTGSSDGHGNHVVGNKIYAAGGPGYDEPMEGWHICPPAMGIYQDCYIEARADVFINDVFVRPQTEKSAAEVWIEIYNATIQPKQITLDLSLFGKNFRDTVFMDKKYIPSTTIVPGIGDMVKPTDWQMKPLNMEYGPNYLRIPINIDGFKQWDPDHPWLYMLHVKIRTAAGEVNDQYAQHFGMRSFSMDTVNIPKGRMYLNGKQIRLRGANSMGFEQNDVISKNWKQLIDDILLAKLCNMNFIRFTQRPVQEEVYAYCDMLGMLNQTDLPFFGAIRVNQLKEAVKQAEEMERLVRKHPSTVVVTYINERFPNAEGSPHRSFSDANAIYSVFKALDQAVLLSNPDRIIKAGDGDYDPPSPGLPDNHCYNTWYNGHAMDLGKFHKGYWQLIKPDWLYGCGEFGAEGLDPLNTMKKYYPSDWLPRNDKDDLAWNPSRISKAQTNTMHHMWYPTQTGIQNWIDASQDFQAWAMKLVAEAFRRDSRNVSFAVHLFIDAWPAGWMKAIMDVDRQPKKAFFAYRNALAPLMISLRTDRFSLYAGEKADVELWVCNDKNEVPQNHKLGYEVVVDGKVILRQMTTADVAENSSRFQGSIRFEVPQVKAKTKAVLRAGIFNEQGVCVHSNEQELWLHPAYSIKTIKAFTYDDTGRSAEIMKEAKLEKAATLGAAKIVLIDNYASYAKHQDHIDAFVKEGGKVLFAEIPEGNYAIAGTQVEVSKTIMGEYYFADPSSSVMKNNNINKDDLFMWYDGKAGYIQPLLRNVFRAPGWSPIITTGLCNFGGVDPSGYLAAASLQLGKGRFIFCEVTLAGRMATNPPAMKLLKTLFEN